MWEEKMWQRMRKMQRKMDRLFGNVGTIGFGSRFEDGEGEMGKYRKAWADFKETEGEFIMEIELPGIEKGNIKLDLTETGVEIRAEKKLEKKKEDKENGEYSYSKSYSGFARRIDLPEEADLTTVNAEYKYGVLKIKVGKKKIKVERRGREIKIK